MNVGRYKNQPIKRTKRGLPNTYPEPVKGKIWQCTCSLLQRYNGRGRQWNCEEQFQTTKMNIRGGGHWRSNTPICWQITVKWLVQRLDKEQALEKWILRLTATFAFLKQDY